VPGCCAGGGATLPGAAVAGVLGAGVGVWLVGAFVAGAADAGLGAGVVAVEDPAIPGSILISTFTPVEAA
jgi:hypothetical protein